MLHKAHLNIKVKSHKDCEELQNDMNKIYEWNKTWEMKFNARKMPCIGNGKKCNGIPKEKKDLGVVIQDNLLPEKPINRIFYDTFRMLKTIRMAFHFIYLPCVQQSLKALLHEREVIEAQLAVTPRQRRDVVGLLAPPSGH